MGTIGISRGFIKVYLLVSSNMASWEIAKKHPTLNGGFASTPCLNIGGSLWLCLHSY